MGEPGAVAIVRHQRQPVVRILVFLLGSVLLFAGLVVAYQAIATLRRLEVVEAERDKWQRPDEVIKALDLRQGSVVEDLGCGAGYFTLKLSRSVGTEGHVIAIDIRRVPLAFLRMRALLQGRWNIRITPGEANETDLPVGSVDAILISNTYHELTERGAVLASAFRTLRPGGRLVIVDRGPEGQTSTDGGATDHELPLSVVEADLDKYGFDQISQVSRFVDRPPDQPWWLVVAGKP